MPPELFKALVDPDDSWGMNKHIVQWLLAFTAIMNRMD
ncbi:hypothetical protein JCM19238_5066 [Vibrio ponticus]|nr:hypothetical protein JCM19238_5066 [Vibrio ponticus]